MTEYGYIGMAAMLALLILRFPLPVSALAVALTGLLVTGFVAGEGLASIVQGAAAEVSAVLNPQHVAIVAVYVLLGNLAFYSGISTRIYDVSTALLRQFHGGRAVAALLGCGGFASLSGASVACASTMGRICVPEMQKQGYDLRLATGVVAAGGTVGALMPPSLLFIIYGLITQVDIGGLFLAGILPALLSLLGMIVVVIWWVHETPNAAPSDRGTPADRGEAILALWPALVLMVALIGGLISGVASLPGIGVLAVLITLAIGVLQQRLTWHSVYFAVRESAMQALVILVVIAAAQLYLAFLRDSGVPRQLVELVNGWPLPGLTVMAIIAVIILIMGMVLEPLGILVLSLPLIVAAIEINGVNAIWFGVVLVKLLEMGLITPPVGLNVFVISGVCPGIPSDTIFQGAARFLAVDLLVLAVLILVPVLSTGLPALTLP